MKPVYDVALKIKRLPLTDEQFNKVPKFGLKLPLYPYQAQGLYYMYAAKRCILADATGLGKTAQCLALMQLLESRGEENKWIIVAPPPTILQWSAEFDKFATLPHPILGIYGRRDRVNSYIAGFMQSQSMIISYQVLIRDWEMIQELGIKNWIFDDAHFFRHHNTKTARIVKALTTNAERVVLSTATPMQKNPLDLHSLLEAIGVGSYFGSQIGFENHYCVIKRTAFRLRDGITRWKKEFVRARNLDELKRKIQPFVIQRTFEDAGGYLPDLIVKPVWLGLHPEQVRIKEQIHKKMIEAWDEGKLTYIRNIGFHAHRQLCAGTRTLGLNCDVSTKLDAVVQFVEDKLGPNEKVLIYSFYKKTVAAIAERFRASGREDFAVITGDMTNKREREAIRNKFQDDPDLRILIGTDAIKVGLNLQSARYLIMIDLILNAQEVMQLIGRIRRVGAKHKTSVVYMLLTQGTIEEGLYRKLKYEAALYDMVLGKNTSIFPELSSLEMAALMGLPMKDVQDVNSRVA